MSRTLVCWWFEDFSLNNNWARFSKWVLKAEDNPGVIGRIGSVFGKNGVSIQSIIQFDANEAGAEIVVITHEVKKGQISASLDAIRTLEEFKKLSAQMVCI